MTPTHNLDVEARSRQPSRAGRNLRARPSSPRRRGANRALPAKSPADRVEMLAAINEVTPGVDSINAGFATIPAEFQLQRDLAIPRQHSESEALDRFRGFADNNASVTPVPRRGCLSPLPPRHHRLARPARRVSHQLYALPAGDKQGTLQAMFEFQTIIASSPGWRSPTRRCSNGSTGRGRARDDGIASLAATAVVASRVREVLATTRSTRGFPSAK